MAMGRGLRVLHNLAYISGGGAGGPGGGGQGGGPQQAPATGASGAQQSQPYSVVIEQRGKSEVLLMENHAIVALRK